VDAANGAVAVFARDLRMLRKQAGSPTYREMARTALYSSSVLSGAASGHRLPTLPATLAFVAACGGDREAWARRWHQVSGNSGGYRGAPPVPPAARTAPPEPQAVVQPAPVQPAPVQPAPVQPAHLMPPRPPLPRPAQLPQRPRGYVNRAVELRRLEIDPAWTTPVVVTGPVGVGKSEFALRYAHEVATEMTDGQLYADLGTPDLAGDPDAPDTVITGFLTALGVTAAELPTGPGQRAGLYRTLLNERRLVVLLDNVRDESQVRPLLGETRRSLTIIVGRAPLHGIRDVRRVHLDVLDRRDSVAVIATAASDAARHPQACERLAELCGDLPLALDVAARKLAMRPDVPLPDLVAPLAETGGLLAWLRLGDISVRTALDSAFEPLSGPAMTMLEQLARRPAGEIVRARTPWPDDELLDELVEAGMLRPGPELGSYRLDELVRTFVVERGSATTHLHLCRQAGHGAGKHVQGKHCSGTRGATGHHAGGTLTSASA
jgi:hypothetical protein